MTLGVQQALPDNTRWEPVHILDKQSNPVAVASPEREYLYVYSS
jgi:hypothetical protein